MIEQNSPTLRQLRETPLGRTCPWAGDFIEPITQADRTLQRCRIARGLVGARRATGRTCPGPGLAKRATRATEFGHPEVPLSLATGVDVRVEQPSAYDRETRRRELQHFERDLSIIRASRRLMYCRVDVSDAR